LLSGYLLHCTEMLATTEVGWSLLENCRGWDVVPTVHDAPSPTHSMLSFAFLNSQEAVGKMGTARLNEVTSTETRARLTITM